MRSSRIVPALLYGWLAIACGGGDDPAGPNDDRPIPPAGPNWSVSPVPIETLARITPLGYNNKPLPVAHTYWLTCDFEWLMPSGRPCTRELQPLRAPGDAVIRDLNPGPDGFIVFEGPPGLVGTFGHVTPVPGLAIGDAVQAGDVIATMFVDYGFDFGVTNPGNDPLFFVRPERAPELYRSQSPIVQFPEPLRSQMIGLVQTQANPLGRLEFDVAGTASGYWFREGTPVDQSFCVCQVANHLFLGTLQERNDTRIMTVGEFWPGQPNFLLVIDPAEPSWTAITPASGPVTLKAWSLERDGSPMYSFPHGTVLVEMLDDVRIRVEWFDTHDEITAFTAAARIYER